MLQLWILISAFMCDGEFLAPARNWLPFSTPRNISSFCCSQHFFFFSSSAVLASNKAQSLMRCNIYQLCDGKPHVSVQRGEMERESYGGSLCMKLCWKIENCRKHDSCNFDVHTLLIKASYSLYRTDTSENGNSTQGLRVGKFIFEFVLYFLRAST